MHINRKDIVDAATKPLRPRIVALFSAGTTASSEERLYAVRATSNFSQFSVEEIEMIEDAMPISSSSTLYPPVLTFFTKKRYLPSIMKRGVCTPEALEMPTRSFQSSGNGELSMWACYAPDISRQAIPEVGAGYGEVAVMFLTSDLMKNMTVHGRGCLSTFDKYATKGWEISGRIHEEDIWAVLHVGNQSWEMGPENAF